MAETVKLFMSNGAQAVRLPKHYRFDTKEVSIRHGKTGEVILSPRQPDAMSAKSDWSELFAMIKELDEPRDILDIPRQLHGTRHVGII